MHPVLRVAERYLGTHDGSPFLAFLGLPKGLAWCLAYALFCWHVAVPTNPFPRVARCSLFWEKVSDNPMRFKAFEPEDADWGIEKPQPGDIAIFAHNPNPNVRNWDGHAVLVLEALPHGHFKTIEGNTSSNDKGDQRNGNTVALKERRAGVRGFLLEGFARPR